MNTRGTPSNLVAAHPGNENAVRHGVYAHKGRVLAPRAEEIADELIRLPHISSALDGIGAGEIGALLALIERLDEDIGARGVTGRGGDVRGLIKMRVQASRRLESWLREYALTPSSRARFLHERASGSLAFELARRKAEEPGNG
jgi:hypothetical protein